MRKRFGNVRELNGCEGNFLENAEASGAEAAQRAAEGAKTPAAERSIELNEIERRLCKKDVSTSFHYLFNTIYTIYFKINVLFSYL